MKISTKGIELIKKFEGCVLKAYPDKLTASKILTIGYGHTGKVFGKPQYAGMTITKEQAEELLVSDLATFESKVDKYNKYQWSQNEFDALVSFAYNIGSIDQLTQNGTRTKAEIAEHITAYCHSNGKVVKGLQNRRQAEKELFLSGSSKSVEYYPKYTGKSDSIVEILNSYGVKNVVNWKSRKAIATLNNISNYTGSALQNMKLVALAKNGKLRKE